ncbi:multidrug ABC transporter ATP-binding protein [Wenjunlia vitaminophila]|uniref:Multidrug ABC transporter ATP-binding protein n=1 Tax=Wenjunlia vitaminophila TaxID=76728 RepID=A0A0T6LWL7_WENVI|nr:ABC transporter ATP-binding protein [Wenjunlia vitaminophila]KRV50551.1 multidrug ABC transporter ATP-binding protein [Wenjunlia vitaminophila]
MVAVKVSQLRVVRGGREVLHGIDCSLPEGTITGLIGPSGQGKSTLMRSIMGVQIVKSGEVTVLGRPAGHPELRHRIGYAPQSPALYGDLTVTENLRYFASVLQAPRSAIDRAIRELSLEDCRHQVAASLSGGQRSRASLAIAFLGDPELLVLDEPTVGLDPVLRHDLWGIFHQLAESGTTLVVSSHVMDEANRCQRLLLLRDGNILADDTPEGLRQRTGAEDLEQAFLSLIQERQAHHNRPSQRQGPSQQGLVQS